MTLDDYFGDDARARRLFDRVAAAVARLGKASIRVGKSQVAIRRSKNVAVAWRPAKYLDPPVAPLVLTLSFPRRDASPRWKEVTRVAPKRYTHHLELRRVADVDAQVREWLRRAWEAAA